MFVLLNQQLGVMYTFAKFSLCPHLRVILLLHNERSQLFRKLRRSHGGMKEIMTLGWETPQFPSQGVCCQRWISSRRWMDGRKVDVWLGVFVDEEGSLTSACLYCVFTEAMIMSRVMSFCFRQREAEETLSGNTRRHKVCVMKAV